MHIHILYLCVCVFICIFMERVREALWGKCVQMLTTGYSSLREYGSSDYFSICLNLFHNIKHLNLKEKENWKSEVRKLEWT